MTKEFLKKLKLVDDLEMELQTDTLSFLRGWEEYVDYGSTSFFTNPFEAFSSSKNELIGKIDHQDFKIRKRRKLFDYNLNTAVGTGSYIEENGTLFIKAEIVSFHPAMFIFLGFIIFVYVVIGVGFVANESESALFVLPFLMFHSSLMLGVPYFMLRRSVKKLKRELEREFYYMIKS